MRIIIWTNQRTGGTTFAKKISEQLGKNLLHEPFNRQRQLGHITESVRMGEPSHSVLGKLDNIFEEEISFKHCVEEVPLELSLILQRCLSGKNYKHIFLTRTESIERLLSYAMAKTTGVWGPQQVKKIYSGDFYKHFYTLMIRLHSN